jgi:DNA-directed RNA polymerase subunit RPC12/RpoP
MSNTDKATPKKKTAAKKGATRKKRTYTDNKIAVDPGVKCPHCKERYGHKILYTYPNGNRRRKCGNKDCGKPFVTMRLLESSIS